MSKKQLTLLFSILLFTSCREASNLLHSTIESQSHDYKTSTLALKSCKVNEAISIVKNNKNILLKSLELGLGNYYKDDYLTSNKHFDIAINEYRKDDNKALFDISSFLKKEYQLEGYDKVLLHNYKALNYLLRGEAEKARVEAKNSNILQKEEQKKLKRFKKINSKENLNKHLFSRYEKLFNHVNAQHNPYQNPFAYYISALAYAEDEDYENALIDINQAKIFFPNAKVLEHKLKQYKEQNSSNSMELFFDIGEAPVKSQVALKLNMGNDEQRMAYLPSFHLEINDIDHIDIKDSKGNTIAKSSILVDINAIKINEFKEKLPSMLYLISQQASISLTSSKLNAHSKVLSGLFNAGAAIYGQNSTATWSFLPEKTLVISFVPKASETYSIFVVSKNGEVLDEKLLTWKKNKKIKNIYKSFTIRLHKICKGTQQ